MLRVVLFHLMTVVLGALTATLATGQTMPPPSVPRIARPVPLPSSASPLPPLPPATLDNSLSVEGDALEGRRRETRLTVGVVVNNQGPFAFLVDSGADTSVIGVGLAERLTLPPTRPALLNGMAGRSLVPRVKVDTLRLGRASFQDLSLPALRERDLGAEGILGIDALANQRLLIDFEKSTITAEHARRGAFTLGDGEIVVVARRRRGQLILTEVTAGRSRLDAVIDTGSEITIGNSALRDKLTRPGQVFTPAMMTDVTGQTMTLQVTVIPALRIGPIQILNVPVAFADIPPFATFGLSKGPALLLGTDVLSVFRRLALDFRDRRVRFQLRRCVPQGVLINSVANGPASRVSTTDKAVC